MAGVRALLARWRADRGLLALLVCVVAVTAGLVGAVPRMLGELTVRSLEQVLDDARVDQVGLAATTVQRLVTGDPEATQERLDEVAAAAGAALGADLEAVVGRATTVVDSVRYDLAPLPGEPADPLSRKLTVRSQQGIDRELDLVAGVLPDGVVPTLAMDLGATRPDGTPVDTVVRVHEFVVTAETAASLGLSVGDRRVGMPDPSGPVLSRLVVRPATPVVFELAGIVELGPVTGPVWFGDPRLHRASRFDTNTTTTIFGFGVVPESAVSELPGGSAGQVAQVGVRWRLDRDALLAADVDAVQRAALALRTSAPTELDEPRWATGLDRVLATESARRATAVEVLGLAAVSLLGVAMALLVAVADLLAGRRRQAVALVRGRGASRPQLVLAASVETVAVVVAAAGVAGLVLRLVVPGAGGGRVVLGVAAVAGVVLVAGAVGDIRRGLGALLSERRRGRPARPARHVLDGLLVLVAFVAVSSLRRRGIDVDGSTDPLVVAAPVLVAAAAAVVTARIAPLPLRAAEAAARRGRWAAVPVGLARAARAPGAAVVVVLLVLGLGVAGLAASVHRSLVAGQTRAAQERVGADVRIDAPPLSSLAPDWMPPAASDVVADLSLLRGSLVTGIGAQRLDVLLVDPAQLRRLDDDLGGLPPLVWDGIGAAPVVVSDVLRPAGSPDVDDTVTVLLGLDRVAGRIVAVDPRVLGLDDQRDGPFVVLDRAAAVAATGLAPGTTSRLVRSDDPGAVETAALTTDPDADVLVRPRIERALREAPLSQGVRWGFLVAAAAAALATGLAVVLALAAAAPGRRRQAAVLSALGTPRGGVRTAVLAEVLPVVAIAATTGVALAALVSVLLGDRLDLSPFTGTVDATGLSLPPAWLGVALVLGAVAVTAVAALTTLGRIDPGALLREGDG